jgi:starch phosphorylase
MDIHYGYSVNGVAALHTEILRQSELRNFSKIYPGKFNNKTNGITFRRWLMHCNPELTEFIRSLIGDGFLKDAVRLEGLLKYADDPEVLNKLLEIKAHNKANAADFLKNKQNIEINTDSIFDVQVKRLHEYKRQQMNALYVINKYFEIKSGKKPARPITVVFGAKAAPAYVIAKDIIHLILCLQDLCANDPEVAPFLRVVMIENYNVQKAGIIIPAADISEQISLASKEASGTSNMKFMLNGAITLGTEDGANVEIHELVGDDNIYIFGEKSDTVIGLYDRHAYVSRDLYENDGSIKKLVDFIVSPKMVALGNSDNLNRLHNELIVKDWFMTLLDIKDYIRVKDKMLSDYEDRRGWAKMCINNIAKAGFFSSDRTIAEYNSDIWHLR